MGIFLGSNQVGYVNTCSNLLEENLFLNRTISNYSGDITTIGERAFRNCTSLTTVSLSQAITINASAFEYCTSLTTVSLPQVTTIDSYA